MPSSAYPPCTLVSPEQLSKDLWDGAAEMVQPLRALAALAGLESESSQPCFCNSAPGNLTPSSGYLRNHESVHVYTCACTPIHKFIKTRLVKCMRGLWHHSLSPGW